MNKNIFTPDFKLEPYWWDKTPRPELSDLRLPEKTDVAIIGSGYTGLSAALTLARSGRPVTIFDAQDAGWGCSSRNGGQISTSIKPDLTQLAKKHGKQAAIEITREGHNALDWVKNFVTSEKIECNFKVPGRFHAAHNPKQFKKLAKQIDTQHGELKVRAHIVPRSEQRRELGTDIYYGGVVFEEHASLDPARFHQGLLKRVQQHNVTVVSHCPVSDITNSGNDFIITTAKGKIMAKDVIAATNGYTGELFPWQRRRIIPIGSYMIATEALDQDLMSRLMPTDRIVSDSRKVVYYYRPSPDRSCILFGGRVSSTEISPELSASLLWHDLIKIFPELEKVKISHSWMGYVAYTFDTLAHVGKHKGIYYAMGYCGSGVSMAAYLGMRVAQQLLGMPQGKTAFDNIRFPTVPFYTGNPWFLAPSVAYYRWMDS